MKVLLLHTHRASFPRLVLLFDILTINRPREDDSRQQTGLSSDFREFQRFPQTPKNQQYTILVIFAFMSKRHFDEKFSREFSIKQPR